MFDLEKADRVLTKSKKAQLRTQLQNADRRVVYGDFYDILITLTPKEKETLIINGLYEIWKYAASPANFYKKIKDDMDKRKKQGAVKHEKN